MDFPKFFLSTQGFFFFFFEQPLNTDLNPFIHIYPSNGGKGKKVIIDIRNNLIKVLKKFSINAIYYDVYKDSTFSPLHLKNVKNYLMNNVFYLCLIT